MPATKSKCARRSLSIPRENGCVSDLVLTPRSALDRVLVPGHYGAEGDAPGITISEQTDLALATVMARKGQSAELSARVKALFAVELPMTPRHAATSQVHFIWTGPGRWLAATRNRSPSIFEGDLRQAFSGLASVTSQNGRPPLYIWIRAAERGGGGGV